MSGILFVTIEAALDATTPLAVLEWLSTACSGTAPPPPFEVDDDAADMIDETPWLLGLDGGARVERWGLDWLVSHHTRLGMGDGIGLRAVYGTMLLLAPHCRDGLVGVNWTEFSPVPSLFLVQRGPLFTAEWGHRPIAVGAGDPPGAEWDGEWFSPPAP